MSDLAKELIKAVEQLRQGNPDKAEHYCRRLLKKDPSQTEALHLLGLAALRKGKHDSAIKLFREALLKKPNEPRYHFNMGYACFRVKKFAEAAKHFGAAVRLRSTFGEAFSYFSLALLELGRLEDAMSSAETALQCNSRSAEIQSNYAQVCEAWGDNEKALKYYCLASKTEPSNPAYQLNKALSRLAIGDGAEAEAGFRSAIALKPLYGEPYWGLARMGLVKLGDDAGLIRHLEQSASSEELEPHHRSPMLFALGHTYHRYGDYEKAFTCIRKANRIDDEIFKFSVEDFAKKIDRIKKVFTANLINNCGCLPSKGSPVPVFVIGMPRSGSSLLEQFLAGHPGIFGAGELRWLSCVESKLNATGLFPESVYGLNAGELAGIGQEYVGYLKRLSQGEPYVVDKCLSNFLHLGLLRMVLPNARVIHCRRDARDTCLSIFFNRFPRSVYYGCDMFKLGAYYRLYEQLMGHWRQSVGASNILDVYYEEMVNDPEPVLRRVIKFVGLPWSPECLNNQTTRRSVRTASDNQVRKPVYRSSVNRWKQYAAYLPELEHGLKAGLE